MNHGCFYASRYDTCPSYASVVDGRTQITDSVADVKYEGDAVEDPDEPRSNIEGEYIPPERDVVNCWEGFKRSPNSKTMVLTLGTFALSFRGPCCLRRAHSWPSSFLVCFTSSRRFSCLGLSSVSVRCAGLPVFHRTQACPLFILLAGQFHPRTPRHCCHH
jgi:hypothetical protein